MLKEVLMEMLKLLVVVLVTLLLLQLHGNANKLGNKDAKQYLLKDDVVVINGKIKMPAANSGTLNGTTNVDYPEGYTNQNTLILGIMAHNTTHTDWWSTTSDHDLPSSNNLGSGNLLATLKPENISVSSTKVDDVAPGNDVTFKIILAKIPNYEKNVDYTLGDVNKDGEITKDDLTLLQNYIAGTGTLTEKQLKAADVNKDGYIDTGDTYKLSQYLNGSISSLE